MKCSELKENDIVVFDVGVHKEEVYDGNVVFVDEEQKVVHVVYLEGYKSRDAIIPYKKMIAKYDKNGEHMKFGGWISGPSVLLVDE